MSSKITFKFFYMVQLECCHFNAFPASGEFSRLLITFASSLDPDQARQNVELDLEPNCLTLWSYS